MVTTRRFYLCGLYATAAVGGARAALLAPDRQLFDVLLSLAAGLASALLVDADARATDRTMPRTALWIVFFLWPIAGPGYFVATRKLRGVLLVVLHGVLLLVAYGVAAAGARWLTAAGPA